MVTITYYNDFKREVMTVPVDKAPSEFWDPQATTEDLRKMHARLQKERKELSDYLDQLDLAD